ncbi:MAG: STAS domain-containing protein [Pseudomonadota bacterium]
MPKSTVRSRQVHRLTVETDMTVHHAANLKPILLESLAKTEDLELDLSQVGDMDTAGLQLLILLKREAQREGKSLRLAHHHPVVRELVEFLNMAAYFGDPLVIPARAKT